MLWEEITNKSDVTGRKIQHVFQEEVQKAILACMNRVNVFNDLVFQGGTSLRLFYGNPRFSEDLDFVLLEGKKRYDLSKKVSKIRIFIDNLFPFLEKTNIQIQKNAKNMQRFLFKTISELPDQKLRIHIELAYVPSYQNQPKILDYPPLNPAIRVEHPSEILADKLTALGNRPYVKGRDIWDIYFLIVEKQIDVPWNLVMKKADDYETNFKELKKNLLDASKHLRTEGMSILSNEMTRFLPVSLFDQYSNMFHEIASRVAKEVELVKNIN